MRWQKDKWKRSAKPDENRDIGKCLSISFKNKQLPQYNGKHLNSTLTSDNFSKRNSMFPSYLFKTIKEINFAPLLKKDRQLLWITTVHLSQFPFTSHILFKSHGPCKQRLLTKILPQPKYAVSQQLPCRKLHAATRTCGLRNNFWRLLASQLV